MPALPPGLMTVLLLIGSNIFMTFAWYGHLKVKHEKLWILILVSWGIAFFEYCLMVPANRIGYGVFSAAQLKTIQEVITLSVFVLFSVFYLGEAIRWTHIVGFALIALGAGFIFYKG
ncbi:DMT family protein [Asticcacaulis excentricus]|uniref:Putative membrane protein n=1 Tax=Asticcacaulis excentricus TaxID=78587 RepID=A0A3G9G1D3_9CAUL|nr:DMT family protein [Asticcacaulis excentricus]BBF80456.1 putative membrane protein [Asticcacaulis excentricus]